MKKNLVRSATENSQTRLRMAPPSRTHRPHRPLPLGRQPDSSFLFACRAFLDKSRTPPPVPPFRPSTLPRGPYLAGVPGGSLQFFLSNPPATSSYIRALTLCSSLGTRYLELDAPLLADILAKLPQLKELYLQSMAVHAFHKDDAKVAINNRALDVLSFKNVTVFGELGYSSLLQILQQFSSVGSLHVEEIKCGYDKTSPDAAPDVLLHLDLGAKSHSLKNHRTASLLFIRAFMKFPPETIQSLYLEMTSTSRNGYIVPKYIWLELQSMLQVIGPGLQNLTWRCV